MKKSIGPGTLGFPLPVYMVGTYNDENIPNVMAASWAGICNSIPPCIAVSVRKERYTYKNIIEMECFSMAIPSSDLVKEADYLGIYSGKDSNKIKDLGLTHQRHDTLNCPIIQEFPVTLICKLSNSIDLGSHTQFIGEIIDVVVDDSILVNGKPNLDLLNTFCYDYTTKTYKKIGDKISRAYLKHTQDRKDG